MCYRRVLGIGYVYRYIERGGGAYIREGVYKRGGAYAG